MQSTRVGCHIMVEESEKRRIGTSIASAVSIIEVKRF
jgi:hypothetical protein